MGLLVSAKRDRKNPRSLHRLPRSRNKEQLYVRHDTCPIGL